MYKIGDVTIIDGEKRKVTGFCLVGGVSYPNTEPTDDAVTIEGETAEEKLRKELEEKIRAEILAEMQGERSEQEDAPKEPVAPEDEGKDPNLSKNLNCQYCGRECGSPVGLMSHEKACKMNPENGGEK